MHPVASLLRRLDASLVWLIKFSKYFLLPTITQIFSVPYSFRQGYLKGLMVKPLVAKLTLYRINFNSNEPVTNISYSAELVEKSLVLHRWEPLDEIENLDRFRSAFPSRFSMEI